MLVQSANLNLNTPPDPETRLITTPVIYYITFSAAWKITPRSNNIQITFEMLV